jgi:predicted AAA+ superfamily ATPase
MRETLGVIIDEFHERDLPVPVPRDRSAPEFPGKAVAVVGMRRVGKTWFCYQRMQELLSKGIPKERLLYLNFEDDRLLSFGAGDFQKILDVYFSKFPAFKDGRCHLFLDEIQRVDDWEVFVRRVLDTEAIDVWVTGSSSKLLSKEIASSLRGRSLPVEIFPLSFEEFLRFRGVQIPRPLKFGSKSRALLQNMSQQYLVRGGFPEIQSIDEEETRHQILRNQVDVVVLRDVAERHSVTNLVALRRLIGHLVSSPATRFSVNKFYNSLRSQGVSCTKDKLYEYLDHLTDAYMVHQVPVHSRSERVRRVNPTKTYISDSGLLDAGSSRTMENRGALLENVVYTHLRGQGVSPDYVVNRSGSEVDFLIPDRKAEGHQLIQVCWSLEDEVTREREVSALKEAMKEFRLITGTIVTWSDEEQIDKTIEVVPAYRWLLEKSAARTDAG